MVDRSRRFLGVVSVESLGQAVGAKGSLEQALLGTFSPFLADTALNELISQVAAAPVRCPWSRRMALTSASSPRPICSIPWTGVPRHEADESPFLAERAAGLVLLASPSCGPMRWRQTLERACVRRGVDPWGSTDPGYRLAGNQIEAADTTTAIDWLDPFQQALVPLDTWVEGHRLAGGEPAAAVPADPRTGGADPERHDPSAADGALHLMMGLLALLAWQLVNGRMALGTLAYLLWGSGSSGPGPMPW